MEFRDKDGIVTGQVAGVIERDGLTGNPALFIVPTGTELFITEDELRSALAEIERLKR